MSGAMKPGAAARVTAVSGDAEIGVARDCGRFS
jgi:hypothetical protein